MGGWRMEQDGGWRMEEDVGMEDGGLGYALTWVTYGSRLLMRVARSSKTSLQLASRVSTAIAKST